MFRFADFSSSDQVFHLFVSRLIHSAGWTLIDAQINGSAESTWPLPTEAASIIDFDFAILRPPAAGLGLNGDAFEFRYRTGPDRLILNVHRLGTGTDEAWDATSNMPDGSAVTITRTLALDDPAKKVFIWADEQSTWISHIDDDAVPTFFRAVWAGYLETAVLIDVTTPTLGEGVDPYPAAVLDLDAEDGETFDDLGAVAAVSVVKTFTDTAGDPVFTTPISWDGYLDLPVMVQGIASQDEGATGMPRGVIPGVYVTSETNRFVTLEIEADSTKYVTVGNNYAVGAL